MRVGFLPLLFLLFLGLKLTGHIDWSWWWVTAPIWGVLVIGLLVFLVGLLFLGSVAKEIYKGSAR